MASESLETKTTKRKRRDVMRGMLLGLVLAMVAGCAHGLHGEAARDVRGVAKVGAGARLLVGGPAMSVHTNVDGSEPVALFVVDRVNGDDRDCASGTAAHAAPIAPAAGRHIEIAEGRELCAVAQGTHEVLFHARALDPATMVAHK
jgi:hypothetical protein